ncbi:MAG TPA: hypothetical protein VH643_38160 [Gemmataceae bacterium]|jgi:hypothetical protein
MTESFWVAVQEVVDHYLPDEEDDLEVTGEEGDGHIVHDLKVLQAELKARHKQRQGTAPTS